MDKARIIKQSLLCYDLGWLGFIPLLGLVPAIMAMLLSKRVYREAGKEWNPAQKYAFWGGFLGFTSFLISLAIGVLLLVQLF